VSLLLFINSVIGYWVLYFNPNRMLRTLSPAGGEIERGVHQFFPQSDIHPPNSPFYKGDSYILDHIIMPT